MPAPTDVLQPFALLRDIDVRSRRNALGLPQQVEMRRSWSGIGFRLDEVRLVTPVGEVREILEYPRVTRVPGAKPWVRGVANVRGNLLPIMDLRGFLDGARADAGRRSRVLVIRYGELAAGLLVDEVLGLRHFFDEDGAQALPPCSAALAAHLRGAYRHGDALWGVFSMSALAENPQFMEVAARGQV